MIDFRSPNSENACISERSLKNVIQVVVFERRKVHFLKSDVFAMSKRKMCRGITSGVQSYHIAPVTLQKIMHLTWEFMHFSKMVLALDGPYLFTLAKQWEFVYFGARVFQPDFVWFELVVAVPFSTTART